MGWKLMSGSVFPFNSVLITGEVREALLGSFIPHASVWTHLPLHLCTSPHILLLFFVTTDTLHALKMTTDPGQPTTALYSLRSNNRSVSFVRSPDESSCSEQHLLTTACLEASRGRSCVTHSWRSKVIAQYRNCCSVKAYYAMHFHYHR